jgi:hypothetical protein
LPHGGVGSHRDDHAFRFACFLVRDLQLPDGVALAWLSEWDSGNTPPKGDDILREKIAGAHKYGKHAYGSGLARQRLFRRNRITFNVEFSTAAW